MSKVLIIGCGGVASVAIHKCCQVPEVFTEICIASRTKAKCDKLAAELAPTTATKITTAQVDADKVEEVIALIKAYQPDLVMNIALPYQDLTIMDACLACGVNYMDTANYEPENTDDPEWRAIYEKRCKEAGFSAYFDYSWQWAYAKKFEEAGLTALLGSGFDPGVTQAYCAYAKKHEFDTIDTIDILDCNGGDHGYAFATNFNPEINLREVSAPGSYWENGHWVEIPAMSIKREYNFVWRTWACCPPPLSTSTDRRSCPSSSSRLCCRTLPALAPALRARPISVASLPAKRTARTRPTTSTTSVTIRSATRKWAVRPSVTPPACRLCVVP